MRPLHGLPLGHGLHRIGAASPRRGDHRQRHAELRWQTVDLSQPFERLTIVQAIRRHAPDIPAESVEDIGALSALLRKKGIDLSKPPLLNAGLGALQLALFEEVAEAEALNPTSSSTTPSRSLRWPEPQMLGPA